MRTNGAWRGRQQHSGGEDIPPTGEEAREQRRATSLPIVWLGLGLAIIVVFAAVLFMRFGVPGSARPGAQAPQSAAGAPAKMSK